MATNLHLLSSMFRRIMLQCPLRVVALLILFITGIADRALGSPAPSCTEREFLRLFPEAKKDGACYLFRLGECEIVAVTNTYGGGGYALCAWGKTKRCKRNGGEAQKRTSHTRTNPSL